MTDPQRSSRAARSWDVAPSPDDSDHDRDDHRRRSAGNDGGRNTTLAATATADRPAVPDDAACPGASEQEFVLQRPFVPGRKANQLVVSFMAARTDGENYGKLVSYEMPTTSVAPSPARCRRRSIEADPDISREFSLLDQRGSSVIQGQTCS